MATMRELMRQLKRRGSYCIRKQKAEQQTARSRVSPVPHTRRASWSCVSWLFLLSLSPGPNGALGATSDATASGRKSRCIRTPGGTHRVTTHLRGARSRKGKPASKDLLPQLDGKCLIIKDLTTFFPMRDDKVTKILGDLQSIYDGEYKATGTLGGNLL